MKGITGYRLLIAAVLAVVLTTAAFASGTQESSGGPISNNPRARVTYLEGDVTVNGETAVLGNYVAVGSTVTTGEDALLEITFSDRNIFEIQANTVAVVSVNDKMRSVDLKTGSFGAVFDKLQTVSSSGGDGFRVTAPTAVGGVRGTTFFFEVEDQDNTYVCACNGTVAMADADRQQVQEVTAKHHKAFRYTRGSDGTITVNGAGMLYHTDDQMNQLASRIGVSIPWQK